MQDEFHVYGRLGEPCDRCGRPIERIVVGGRGTWFCPHCQRRPEHLATLCLQALPRVRGRRRGRVPRGSYTRSMAAPSISEAVVLRSFPFGEADRVLHVYTAASGRLGAIAKGVRRTKSRFGGRLEPFSHVELSLHRGRGELATVTGASLVRSHDRVRSDPRRLQIGLVGLEAMLRLFTEEERNERAFLALTRFLDALDEHEPARGARPGLDPLVLSFQLKLLWLSGFMPHLGSCVECGAEEGLVAFDPSAGGAVCAGCDDGAIALSPEGLRGLAALLGDADRRCLLARARRPRVPRRARSRHLVVRAPRRLPPANARLASASGQDPSRAARRYYPARAGGLHGAARRSRRCASAPPIGIRSWASVSRSRSVTVSSSSV